MATGLDKYHPFNNTPAAELIVQKAHLMLGPVTEQLGWGYSHAVWALMSNFIMLDRLCATYGVTATTPSQLVPRTHCEPRAIGTAAQVRISIIMLSILSHFMISSYMSWPHPQNYSANFVSPGLLVKRLTSKQQPTFWIHSHTLILQTLHWRSLHGSFHEESRKL